MAKQKIEGLPYQVDPFEDRVLIRRDPEADKIDHIWAPDQAKELPMQGTVVAVGEGRMEDGRLLPMPVQVGDRVLITRYAGNEFKFHFRDRDQYVVIRQDEILMRLHPETANDAEDAEAVNDA